jgi:hypothetical protein
LPIDSADKECIISIQIPKTINREQKMNKTLQTFARNYLINGLAQCTPAQQEVFALMYAKPYDPRKRTTDVIIKIKNTPYQVVVNEMPEDKLDWAMQQIEATLEKNKKNAAQN